MAGSLPSRLTRRARQALGAEHLAASLRVVDARLTALEAAATAARWPAPPVYLGDHTALVAPRWGGKLLVDTRDVLLAPWLLSDGLWESHITGWFERSVKPGQVVVDVGANLGYFTVLAGRLVGAAGRVVAVEAHPELAELCRRNTVVNGQHGWSTVWERAAWSGPDRLRFHQRQHYAANSSLASVDDAALAALGDHEVAVEVEAAALDDLLDASPGDGHVDLVKLDVEGAEVHALVGMTRTLAANPGVTMLVEWAPEQLRGMGDDPADLLDVLAGHGFAFRLFEADLAPVGRAELLDTGYGNLLLQRS